MITKPNTVLVATGISTTATETLGTLVLLNAKTGLPVANAASLTGVDAVQFGVIKEPKVTTGPVENQKPIYIAKTKAFKKSELQHIVSTAGIPATEDSFKIVVPSPAGAVVGDNMHVKLNFKVDGYQTQKAEAYVFALVSYASATALAADIADRINKNPRSWVTASVNAAEVTITAKKAIDHQPNSKSINATTKFNQVEFDLAAFKVNGTGPYSAFGTIAKLSNSQPGIGNPYVVRDQERDAFGYEGVAHIAVYPSIMPASSVAAVGGLVNESVQYNCISFTAELAYRAPDESYMKTTPVSAQLYYPHTAGNKTAADNIVAAVKTWAGHSL